jgi:ribosomal protein L39E
MAFTQKITDIITKIDQGIIVTETELERSLLNIVEEELKSKGLTLTVEQQRKIIRGKSDARIGGLVFEFKKPQINQLSDKKKQVFDYIDEYRQQGILLRGILTNGRSILFIDENKQIVEEGDLEDNVWMLEAWVSTLSMKVASPTDLKNALGPTSSIGKAFVRLLSEIFQDHSSEPSTKECYDVWNGVYGCATNLDDKAVDGVRAFASNSLGIQLRTENDVRVFLFVVQTYLSVLMKLLVAEVAIQRSVIPAASLEELLGDDTTSGYQKLSERIPFLSRVFEYDTFYWFSDLANRYSHLSNAIGQFLSDMSRTLGIMDFSEVTTDLVKHIYQEFFDGATRRALGEFYTPDALVHEVLDSVGYSGEKVLSSTLLDPACGSGTFLVTAISRFIDSYDGENIKKPEALKRITDQIMGIDIHPFAVAMAKVNYLLALGRLIDPSVRRELKTLPIPVFWGDSLATASSKIQFAGTAQVKTFEVSVPVLGTFTLPDPNEIDWDRLIDTAIAAVKGKWSTDKYLAGFPEESRLPYKDVLTAFLKVFVERETKGQDGRWLSPLRNFIVVDKMKGRCDFVVGNPPWVRIHNINEDIRKELFARFDVYNQNAKKGKTIGWKPKLRYTKVPFPQQIDYCMAFVEAGLAYLREGGTLGLVLTAKITSALYANLLRKLLIEKTRILKIFDHTPTKHVYFQEAMNSPLVIAVAKNPPEENKVDICVETSKMLRWQLGQKLLPIVSKDAESPWCLAPPKLSAAFKRMEEKGTRFGDVLVAHMGVKTADNGVFLVKSFADTATPGIVTIENEDGEKANIEQSLLRPVLRGEGVVAWDFSPKGYLVWTHDDDSADVKPTLPHNAAEYFLDRKKRLQRRADQKKKVPIWGVFRTSRFKMKEKVAWQEISKMMEAVVVPCDFRDPLLGKTRLIVLQTVYFAACAKMMNLALAALLNSTWARSFFSSFAPRERGYPPRFRHFSWTVGILPLPRPLAEENAQDTHVMRLVELSKRMHKCKGENQELANEIDAVVAQMYGEEPSLTDELKEYLSSRGIPTA